MLARITAPRRVPVLRGGSKVLAGAVAGAVLLGAAPGAAFAQAAPAPAPSDAAVVRLSDWYVRSVWAYPASAAPVRAAPSSAAHVVGRLAFLTGDAQAELYMALAVMRPSAGESWTEISLPGRPNGRSGWVPSAALGALHVVRGYLLIDRARLRATLVRDGRPVFSAPVGVGASGTPTPAGRYYVLERLTTLHDSAYGPHAIGTSAYAPTLSEWPGGGVVGIHGTNEPQLVPGRPSHGCIRMRNADVSRLWQLIVLGTPIEIT